jgi:hypothetical protein
MDLLGSETFQNEDEMLRMWGESMKDVNCGTANCNISYEDFVLLMKGQKRVIPNVRRSIEPLEPLLEIISTEEDEGTEEERPGFISPAKFLEDSSLTPRKMSPDVTESVPDVPFKRQGSNSAPATPQHIGRRFDAIDQTDSPKLLDLSDEGRVTFSDNVLSIPPLDLTPPQTPVRGPQDYVTPSANRVTLNPQLLASLKPPELANLELANLSPPIPSIPSNPRLMPGTNALHSSFTTMSLARGRSTSLDEKDTFTAKLAAESRASMMFKRDSRRAMPIPEHTHNMSELEEIIKDESKTPLVVNRRLYRAHREFRHSVTEACKRFEDEQMRRAKEELRAKEHALESRHTAGLVMRHGQALTDASIRNFLKKTMEEQQAAVDVANRRGGRGKRSRKKTISDMSGMLSPATPEPSALDRKTLNARSTAFGATDDKANAVESTELAAVKENEYLLRNPTKPGEFRKTNYDPFLPRKANLIYSPGAYSPKSTAQQASADGAPPPLPL